MRAFHGYKAENVKNSQQLHVCVLPLQRHQALISFYSSCCSTFFLNVGWTFFLPLKLKVQEAISHWLEPSPPPPDEQRDEEGRADDSSVAHRCNLHMCIHAGVMNWGTVSFQIDVVCFSALSWMSTWHRSSSDRTRMSVYLGPAQASAKHRAGLCGWLLH